MLTQSENWKKQLPAAIDRLRESKQGFHEQQKVQGIEEGRDWALTAANYNDLHKLSFIAEPSSLDDLVAAFSDQGADRAYFFGDPEHDEDPDVSDARVEGFVLGALEVWEEIKDQI